jgi:MFS transporter, FSR family, fosmidomycin resistance protein
MIFLFIEFIDELIFGLEDAAWPLIRTDLHLTYAQIGILLSLPGLVGNLIEPFLFILGDVWRRRVLILGGGVFFTLALVFTAISHNFLILLFSIILFNPASGAYVALSQATWMDTDSTRHEQNMARWTFAGSLGVFLGPLCLGGLIALGFGWRPGFWTLALFSLLILLAAFKLIPSTQTPASEFLSARAFFAAVQNAFSAFRDSAILRWLILLQFANLMLDVLFGFLALYFVDIGGFAPAFAALAVAIWTGMSLLGDFLLIPLVERVRGLDYLRVSVILELVLFPAFLLAPQPWLKLTLLGLLGLFNSGWYAILQAHLYSSLPGKSGTVLALDTVSGLFGNLLPFGVGLAAQGFGLGNAIWLLLAGPIVLLLALPRGKFGA